MRSSERFCLAQAATGRCVRRRILLKARASEIKEVLLEGKRYIVCLNPRQARKEAQDRETIIAPSKRRSKKGKESDWQQRVSKYLRSSEDSVSP